MDRPPLPPRDIGSTSCRALPTDRPAQMGRVWGLSHPRSLIPIRAPPGPRIPSDLAARPDRHHCLAEPSVPKARSDCSQGRIRPMPVMKMPLKGPEARTRPLSPPARGHGIWGPEGGSPRVSRKTKDLAHRPDIPATRRPAQSLTEAAPRDPTALPSKDPTAGPQTSCPPSLERTFPWTSNASASFAPMAA